MVPSPSYRCNSAYDIVWLVYAIGLKDRIQDSKLKEIDSWAGQNGRFIDYAPLNWKQVFTLSITKRNAY